MLAMGDAPAAELAGAAAVCAQALPANITAAAPLMAQRTMNLSRTSLAWLNTAEQNWQLFAFDARSTMQRHRRLRMALFNLGGSHRGGMSPLMLALVGVLAYRTMHGKGRLAEMLGMHPEGTAAGSPTQGSPPQAGGLGGLGGLLGGVLGG